MDFSAGTLKGDACALAATICWSIYTLGLCAESPPPSRRSRPPRSPRSRARPAWCSWAWCQIVGVDWVHVPAPAWGALAYSAVLSLVVAYFIWNASVQRVGGTRTAIYMCLTPLVAALVAWATLGERLVPLQGAGAVLILTGVVMTRAVNGER